MEIAELETHVRHETNFAEKVCTNEVLQSLLSPSTYKEYSEACVGRATISQSAADEIAEAMKEWALEKGATHYCHWFQPWTGNSAEKHDAFFQWANDGSLINSFTGKALVMGEPDASSLPSGGLRNTYEARGYTSWDPSSPAFLWESGTARILSIPSIFFSYTGEALDTKIPLLRSDAKLSRSVARLLTLLGETTQRVFSTLGCEQEFFLVDADYASQRRDLVVSGATVFGAPPAKGQELEDHYFGALKRRVLAFLEDLEEQAYALGIPVKTRHNEVAPAQHEVAPLFERVVLGVDHNILLMQLLKKVADEHHLVCLTHEKPFARVNGSGKHLNWSLSTAEGHNLLDPGQTPQENTRFLFLIAAVLEGIARHPALLRASIGSFENDKRLGGNEAPPGILSVYLGNALDALVSSIAEGEVREGEMKQKLDLGIDMLPDLFVHDTDRNRTSPFAFTGNKFEFRACGSSHSPSFPMTVLNAVIAESIEMLSDELENGVDQGEVLKASFSRTAHVRFLGDNYSSEWQEEAKKRGLPEISRSVDAFDALLFEKTESVFTHILRKNELNSVYEVFKETYKKHCAIERRLMIEICETQLLPAALAYQKEMAESVRAVGDTATEVLPVQKRMLRRYAQHISQLIEALEALKEAPSDDEAAGHLRECADTIEQATRDSLWPMPKYWELLFLT